MAGENGWREDWFEVLSGEEERSHGKQVREVSDRRDKSLEVCRKSSVLP